MLLQKHGEAEEIKAESKQWKNRKCFLMQIIEKDVFSFLENIEQ